MWWRKKVCTTQLIRVIVISVVLPISGVIVSSPTGSTAYSLSAGASMIHPSVPAMLITSINSHSLSFRPVVLPAGVKIKLRLSRNSRNNVLVCLDGRDRQEINFGDVINVTTSSNPVPCICKEDYVSLNSCSLI